MAKICPKCGGKEFYVTAHVTQSWKVDEDGEFLEVTEDCCDVIHRPNDEDVWECASCGYDGAGSEFNK